MVAVTLALHFTGDHYDKSIILQWYRFILQLRFNLVGGYERDYDVKIWKRAPNLEGHP